MSKSIAAAAVANKSSKTTADFFYRDIICRHGTSVEVVMIKAESVKGYFRHCWTDAVLTTDRPAPTIPKPMA